VTAQRAAERPLASAHATAPRRAYGADAMLLVTVVLWAGNFTAFKYALERFHPLTHSSVRFLIAGLIFAAITRVREGSMRVARQDLPAIALVALTGIFLNQVFTVYAVREAGAAEVAMLMASSPVFAALLVVVLGQERVGAAHWRGLAAACAGVLLVLAGASGVQAGPSPLWGGLLGLGTALTWGMYAVWARPLIDRYSPLRLSAWVALLGAGMLLPFAAPQIASQDWGSIGAGRWAAFLYSLFLALVITNVIWFAAIARVGAARATLFMYVQPFAGALIALVLIGEPVHLIQWVGGGLILVGVALARAPTPSVAPD
jgi:drug/metabolite transporter (DMT)-like permease